jgi:hypothetical protein
MLTSKGAVHPHRRGPSGPFGRPDALGTIRWMLEQSKLLLFHCFFRIAFQISGSVAIV